MAASGSSFATPSSPSSKNAGEPYIGNFITLISKYEIRYEGILYCLNTQDSTLGLKNVRSYGTEGRKKDGPQIPASDKVYEYILFRGSDIKDLQVKPSQLSELNEQMHNDPAIIQSGYAAVSSPSPLASGSLAQFTLAMDTPALTSKVYPRLFPSYQSPSQVNPLNSTQTTQNSIGSSFNSAMYWQGHNGTSANNPYTSQHSTPFQPSSTVSSPLIADNQFGNSQFGASPVMGLSNSSSSVTPIPPITSSSINFSFSPTLTPPQSLTSTDMLSPSPIMGGPLSYSTYMIPNRPVLSSTDAPVIGKAVFEPITVNPTQSMPYPGLSLVDSSSGSLLSSTPSLLTSDQLVQSVVSPMQNVFHDQKDLATLTPAPHGMSGSVTQAPLLPLPVSAPQYSTPQFTEEFDFEAMNEKFKKDEIWGYLGKAKQNEVQSVENTLTDQCLENKEDDVKPVYKKDDFFDTISCNSKYRGSRIGQHRFTERMRMDTETFGNFQQKTYQGYGGHFAGRGDNYYRGSNNHRGRGMGYGFGGRGRGGNLPY